MDADQFARIDAKLDRLQTELVPRGEIDRRHARHDVQFDRLNEKLDRALETLSSQDTRIGVVETRLGVLVGLDERVGKVEDVAAVTRTKEERRGWMWPSVATIAAVVLNACLTAVTYLLSGLHHHS